MSRNRAASLWPIAIVPVALLTLAISPSRSQEATTPNRARPADIDHTQYLRTAEDVERLRKLHRRLVVTATAALEARADNPTADNWREARRSVKVLHILRPSDRNSLRALCRNITLNTLESELTPLEGYEAAQALVEIGGGPAAQAIFSSMRTTVDREGLLLRAFVLWGNDSREIALERIRLEIKSAEAKSLDEDALRDSYLKNLRQLDALLNDPKLGNEKNWPGNQGR